MSSTKSTIWCERWDRKKLKKSNLVHSSKYKIGTVVSDSMNNTRVVSVKKRVTQAKYKKVVTRTKRYLVHDENQLSSVGNLVKFSVTRPISKRKRWTIIDVF